MSLCRRMKLDPCLTPSTKINSEWIKDLNIHLETLNLLDEYIDSALQDIDIGKDYLDRNPFAQELRAIIDKEG